MINFLRRIRRNLATENKLTLYLIYAIGEVVLVVLGILIALQIDNWNESRKDNRKMKEHVRMLVKDLEKDILNIKECIVSDSLKNEGLRKILIAFNTNQIIDSSEEELYAITSETASLITHDATYTAMISGNVMELLSNPEIKTCISSYYSKAEHVKRFERWYSEYSLGPLLERMYHFGVGNNLANTTFKMEDQYQMSFEAIANYKEELKGYFTEAQIMTKSDLLYYRDMLSQIENLKKELLKELLN